MKKWMVFLFIVLLFRNLSGTNCNAADMQRSMNDKVDRDNYYLAQHAIGPTVETMTCNINGKEIEPSYGPNVQGVGGNAELEMGTKVKTATISWVLNNDKYVTNQELSFADYNGKYKTVKLGPTTRTYTDKSNYTGKLKNGVIAGRNYELHVQDKKIGREDGASRATISVNFVLMDYYGCSSKTNLSDNAVNNLQSQIQGKEQFQNITAHGEYIYIIRPSIFVLSVPAFKIKEGEPHYGDYGMSLNFPAYTNWDLKVKKHKNSAGFTTNYNVYRTKERMDGKYNFYEF